jgi:FixJ family two-component response regulator
LVDAGQPKTRRPIPLYSALAVRDLAHVKRQFTFSSSYSAKHPSRLSMISIIDDDDSNREAVKSLVRSLGHAAVGFASAEEYLGSGRVYDSECVISDIQMPGMTGIALQDRLLADGYCRPIILMSAMSAEEATGVCATKIAPSRFLKKPLTERSLIQCLDRALKSASP